MPVYRVIYIKEVGTADFEGETAFEVMKEFKKCSDCEIKEVHSLKTYEVEYDYVAHQKERINALSEDEIKASLRKRAVHDPEAYTKEPDVVIKKITEVKEEN